MKTNIYILAEDLNISTQCASEICSLGHISDDGYIEFDEPLSTFLEVLIKIEQDNQRR